MITNRCIGSEDADNAVIQCIIDGFSLYTEYYMKVSDIPFISLI